MGADAASACESIPSRKACSVAINADSSMAWLAVVRIRQRIDSTIVIKWSAVTVVRQLEFAPGQSLDDLTNFLMPRDFLRRIDDLQINSLHGIEA